MSHICSGRAALVPENPNSQAALPPPSSTDPLSAISPLPPSPKWINNDFHDFQMMTVSQVFSVYESLGERTRIQCRAQKPETPETHTSSLSVM